MNGFVVLVLVQLIAESLPISSSSHVEIARMLMERGGLLVAPWSMHFDHLLHGSMILVLVLFFWREWLVPAKFFFRGLRNNVGLLKLKNQSSVSTVSWYRLCRVICNVALLQLLVLVLVTCWYFGMMPILKSMQWFSHPATLVGGLVVTALALLSLRFKREQVYTTFGLREAVVLSIVQMIALLPGISRFASCYVCARWLNISPRRALQVTFAVELPLIMGAFVVHGIPVVLNGSAFNYCPPMPLFACFIAGTACSLVALSGVARLAKRNLMWLFGVYMIVPIVCVVYGFFW